MKKNKLLGYLSVGLFLAFSIVAVGCGRIAGDNSVTIATAANMQFAMRELADRFTTDTGIPCKLTVSSSGKLTAQIREGAPFDLFVSADMMYPEILFREGHADKPPAVYAYGSLVLWTLNDSLSPHLKTLEDQGVRHIAVANPKTAPYGRAALQALEHYGLHEAIKPKLVFGESIAQTNQFVLSGAAEMGFTAEAAVRSPAMQGKGRWETVDPQSYAPIAQGVLLLRTPPGKQAAALAFYEYLTSAEAMEILIKYGYSIDEPIARED